MLPADRARGGERPLSEERLRDLVPPGRHRLQLGDGVRERTATIESPWSAAIWPELALVDEVGGLQPVAGREHAVARGGGATALDVAEHGHARLEAGPLLDLARERLADPAEAHVAELVGARGPAATCRRSPEAYVSS